MTGRMPRRLGLVALGICLGLAGAACAPRYLEKTPASALRYPHIPVSGEELDHAADAVNFMLAE